MTRQTIVEMVLNAYSLEECLSAEEALANWLRLHPQDLGLYELASQLGIVKAAAQERPDRDMITANALPVLAAAGH